MTRTFPKLLWRAAPAVLLLAVSFLDAEPSQAGSVENLERERALLIDVFLDPSLTPAERDSRVGHSMHRLLDLERMVLRDEDLIGRNTPTVKRAFKNYDLTFLVHAATEKDMSVIDGWLEQVGITTQGLMAAKRGRR